MGHRYSIEKAEAFKLEGIIVENILKADTVLEPEDVRSIKDMNLRLCEGKAYALLVDPQAGSTITEEARALLASKEMGDLNIAKAILIYTQKQKILGNLYLTINKPHVNTRIFTDRAKALEWLHTRISEFEAKELLAKRRDL